MFAECVVWKDLDSLDHLEVLEMLSKGSDVLFEITDARNEYRSQPERLFIILEPLCSLEGLLVAAACQLFMS